MKTVNVDGCEWQSLVDAPVGTFNTWPYGLLVTHGNLVDHLLKTTVMRADPDVGCLVADEKQFVIKVGTEAVRHILEALDIKQLPDLDGQPVFFGIPIEQLPTPYGFSVHKIS